MSGEGREQGSDLSDRLVCLLNNTSPFILPDSPLMTHLFADRKQKRATPLSVLHSLTGLSLSSRRDKSKGRVDAILPHPWNPKVRFSGIL